MVLAEFFPLRNGLQNGTHCPQAIAHLYLKEHELLSVLMTLYQSLSSLLKVIQHRAIQKNSQVFCKACKQKTLVTFVL